MKRRFMEAGIYGGAVAVPLFAGAGGVSAQVADIPVYNDIPAYQQKEFSHADLVDIEELGIAVEEVVDATGSPAEATPITEPGAV